MLLNIQVTQILVQVHLLKNNIYRLGESNINKGGSIRAPFFYVLNSTKNKDSFANNRSAILSQNNQANFF